MVISFSSAKVVEVKVAQIPTAAAAATMGLSLGMHFLIMVCVLC
jgi:hypothetical protein